MEMIPIEINTIHSHPISDQLVRTLLESSYRQLESIHQISDPSQRYSVLLNHLNFILDFGLGMVCHDDTVSEETQQLAQKNRHEFHALIKHLINWIQPGSTSNSGSPGEPLRPSSSSDGYNHNHGCSGC